MAQEKKKGKQVLVICLSIVIGLVCLYLLMSLIAFFASRLESVKKTRYVTDYHLDYHEVEMVEQGTSWQVYRDFDHDAYLRIRQWDKTWEQPGDEIYLMSFKVFDSASAAKREYNDIYKQHKAYEAGWKEGEKWFISDVPDVMDATMTLMVYREDNVLIYAYVVCIDEYPHYYEDETEPTGVSYDRWQLKDYIIENAPEIRTYVLHDILGY